MMPISESQLETWSHRGQTGQFTATYETLKTVLHSPSSPYYGKCSFDTFLQGSYGNDTNVYADSDVDIVIWTDSVYYSDVSNLTAEEKERFDKGFSLAAYQWEDFRRDVLSWLTTKYGSAVAPGDKAIFVAGNGSSRRDADVVVAAEFRRYQSFSGAYGASYEKGICFFTPGNTRIENFPKQHSANCTTKHQGTNSWFKRTVRIHKNLRNKMIADRLIADGLAPSYFIEGMLYNVPANQFGGSQVQNFTDTLNWLLAAQRSKFVCANELFYLLNDYSPVTWTDGKCTAYLNAVAHYWVNA